jgi:hypothetical protein
VTMLLAHNRGISVAVGVQRLYEKWFEQRLKRGSGRYTESRWVQKVAFWSSRDHVTVVSETFHTVSLKLSEKGFEQRCEGRFGQYTSTKRTFEWSL